MTDSLAKDAQPPIVRLLGKPLWNLKAHAMAYPLAVDSGSKRFQLYIWLLQNYSQELLQNALAAAAGGFRREVKELISVPGDDSGFGVLTENSLMGIEGMTTTDLPTQIMYLNQNLKLKIRASKECLGAIRISATMPADLPESEDERLELLPVALDGSARQTVDTEQELWDPSEKKIVTVKMTHTLRQETESDWRKWERTAVEKFTRGNREWRIGINWQSRVAIYDAMIESVTGFALGEAETTPSNRAAWLSLIPFWHKLLVIQRVFDETRLKNV